MLTTFKNKLSTLSNRIITTRHTLVFSLMIGISDAMAQSQAQGTATKLTGTMTAFLGLMPIVAKIGGIVVLIGGMWSLYQHYKSQGRDGSIAAGIAGLGVGVGLFFMGGLLNFGADSLGITATTALPT